MTRLTSRQLRALNCALLSLCETVTHPQPFESISDSFETALPVPRISVKRKRGSQIVAILGVKVRTVDVASPVAGSELPFRSSPAPRAIRRRGRPYSGEKSRRPVLDAFARERSLADSRDEAPERRLSIATNVLRKSPAEVLENIRKLAMSGRPCRPEERDRASARAEMMTQRCGELSMRKFERGEQERSESPPIYVRSLEQITFQNHEEKILRQILRIFQRVASPADEGKNRPPINAAELGQRFARLSFLTLPIDG